MQNLAQPCDLDNLLPPPIARGGTKQGEGRSLLARRFAGILGRMKVWLTRKYAERIDGVDLSGKEPGDLLDIPREDARMLLAEEWAIPERRESQIAAETPRRRVDDYR
jgi:hypothetical protein